MKKFFLLFLSFLFLNTYSMEKTEYQEEQKENLADKVLINAAERLRHFAVPVILELMLGVVIRSSKKIGKADMVFYKTFHGSNVFHLLSASILPKKIRERTTIFFEDVSIFMCGVTFLSLCLD